MGTFRVTNHGGCIFTKKQRLVGPGQTIDSEEMGESEKEFLRDGKIVQISGTEVKPLPPEVKSATVGGLIVGTDGELINKPAAVIIPTAKKDIPTLTGIWTLHVAEIKDKSLEELNAMILERDASVAPFEDKMEAVAFLSQDLK